MGVLCTSDLLNISISHLHRLLIPRDIHRHLQALYPLRSQMTMVLLLRALVIDVLLHQLSHRSSPSCYHRRSVLDHHK